MLIVHAVGALVLLCIGEKRSELVRIIEEGQCGLKRRATILDLKRYLAEPANGPDVVMRADTEGVESNRLFCLADNSDHDSWTTARLW